MDYALTNDDLVSGNVDIEDERYELLSTELAPFLVVLQAATPEPSGVEDRVSPEPTEFDVMAMRRVTPDEGLASRLWAEQYFAEAYGPNIDEHIKEYQIVTIDASAFIGTQVGETVAINFLGEDFLFEATARADRQRGTPGITWYGRHVGENGPSGLQIQVFLDGRVHGLLSSANSGRWAIKESPQPPLHVLFQEVRGTTFH